MRLVLISWLVCLAIDIVIVGQLGWLSRVQQGLEDRTELPKMPFVELGKGEPATRNFVPTSVTTPTTMLVKIHSGDPQSPKCQGRMKEERRRRRGNDNGFHYSH